jgi:alpha-tubulin suppressor-like RCC1 family protein
MIPIKTVVDKANTKITAGGLTDLEYTQLSGSDVFLDRSVPKSAANVAVLPLAANNEGIIYYVSNEAVYYFSDGTNWSKDFTSDYEVMSAVAYGWGSSSNGKLGDNTTTDKSSPVTVVGGITTWSRISAGGAHSLAVTSAGIAYAWGSNGTGRLGDDTTTARSSPVTVVGGITNWSLLSAGDQHSLGLTSTGIAYAWGYNSYGRLGDNTTVNKSSPVTIVGGITNWSQLSAGFSHSLGITSTGIAYAWGYNSYGRLGDNTTSTRSSPVTVVGGITTWSRASAGLFHSLGLTSTGIAYAWGYGGAGMLGDNTNVSRSSPVTVVGGITTWSQASAGGAHSLAVTSTGIAYAWGTNTGGRLGDGTIVVRSSPVTVVGGITTWSQVSTGAAAVHSLGLTSTGIAYAWGTNTNGRLGDNTTTARSSPVTIVGGITTWSQVSAGSSHSSGINTTTKGFA